MSKGELVIIKSFGGMPLIRRIYKLNEKVVYITCDSMEGIISLGFPREDVFKYDPNVAFSMVQLYKTGKWEWNKLVPY
jgi:hypothetical protein